MHQQLMGNDTLTVQHPLIYPGVLVMTDVVPLQRQRMIPVRKVRRHGQLCIGIITQYTHPGLTPLDMIHAPAHRIPSIHPN